VSSRPANDWDEIRRLFELCRDRSRDEWHSILRAECPGNEALTLLVASESLPPLDEAA
jgi:hypothetical protein